MFEDDAFDDDLVPNYPRRSSTSTVNSSTSFDAPTVRT